VSAHFTCAVGTELPERSHAPDSVALFAYNAAIWNLHRIHYDHAWATQQEGHPGLVIDGPLQGDWLAQCVTNWLADRWRVERFRYRNRRVACLGDSLCAGGRIIAADESGRRLEISLWLKNAAGEVTAEGSATVLLDGAPGECEPSR